MPKVRPAHQGLSALPDPLGLRALLVRLVLGGPREKRAKRAILAKPPNRQH